jgi:uncharacterized protein (DUF1800 family)
MALSTADAAHLLRRAGFGVTPDALAELTKLRSRAAAIDRVCDISADPPVDPPVTNTDQPDSYQAWVQMTEWWVERMRITPTPLVEKINLFWHGHFATSLAKVTDMGLMAGQHLTIRSRAFGDFHDLAQAVAVDPAMSFWLDNAWNLAIGPQENFARELMELFTLGVGKYTQEDVVTMANAWTGYSLDPTLRQPAYYPQFHSTTKGRLFGTTARAWSGPDALTAAVKGTKASVSARFIAAKLFSYLAYPVTAADMVVGPLATAYTKSGRNVMALVKAIFTSTAFWSTTARRALVRPPVDWFVAGLQATGLPASQARPELVMNRVGQALFAPPDVSGWKPNAAWLSAGQMWGRSEWAIWVRRLADLAGVFHGIEGDAPASIAQAGFDRFGITEPSPVTRAAIESFCTKAQAAGSSWVIPAELVVLLLLSPDFQVA